MALRQLRILFKITQQLSNYKDIHLHNYCNKSSLKLLQTLCWHLKPEPMENHTKQHYQRHKLSLCAEMKKVTPYYVIYGGKNFIRIKTLLYHQIYTQFLKWIIHVRRTGNNRTPNRLHHISLWGGKV